MDDNPRSRSRSPTRKAPKGSGGFRWKDKRSADKDGDHRDSGRRGGYRDRSPPRHRDDHTRDDRSKGDSYRNPGRDDRANERKDDRRREDSDKPKDADGENPKKDKKEKKKKKAAAPAGPPQEMIIVNINDRLGTKSAIPCLPSDTVGQLKLMVAARIGREANQIMLKRQGERPFKDMITLEDYGISNGVQLDLEVDTGD